MGFKFLIPFIFLYLFLTFMNVGLLRAHAHGKGAI